MFTPVIRAFRYRRITSPSMICIGWSTYLVLEQDAEISVAPYKDNEVFLLEVMIVCQHFRNAFLQAGVHGDAVGEAVSFVGAALVEVETLEKRFVRLGQNESM